MYSLQNYLHNYNITRALKRSETQPIKFYLL